jgi:hypothetical protein
VWKRLTVRSTIEDLRECSYGALMVGIDSADKEVVLAYILELRQQLAEHR